MKKVSIPMKLSSIPPKSLLGLNKNRRIYPSIHLTLHWINWLAIQRTAKARIIFSRNTYNKSLTAPIFVCLVVFELLTLGTLVFHSTGQTRIETSEIILTAIQPKSNSIYSHNHNWSLQGTIIIFLVHGTLKYEIDSLTNMLLFFWKTKYCLIKFIWRWCHEDFIDGYHRGIFWKQKCRLSLLHFSCFFFYPKMICSFMF